MICDLLHQLVEAHRDLDRAKTDQVVIRGQLTNADTKVASKSPSFLFIIIIEFLL